MRILAVNMGITNKRITELDGLRGLAVLMVMLYHFMTIPVLSGNAADLAVHHFFMAGWVGVDIFFALSGFLITSILLTTRQSTTFFSTFYIKRILRIFPLYYLYLALLFFILFPQFIHHASTAEQASFKTAQQLQVYYWLYLSNIKQFFSYTLGGAGLSHIWSLSIEEQFYMVWPLAVYFLNARQLKVSCMGIILLSVALRLGFYLYQVPLLNIYTFTFTRTDSLTYGAIVAVFLNSGAAINFNKIKKLLYIFLAIVLLLFIIGGPWPNSSPFMAVAGFSIIGIANALLILTLQGGGPSRLKHFFNRPFLRMLGKYSYALYMFHPLVRQLCLKVLKVPVMFFNSQLIWDAFFMILCTVVSIAVAVCSWYAYERWFMNIKARYEHRQLADISNDGL